MNGGTTIKNKKRRTVKKKTKLILAIVSVFLIVLAVVWNSRANKENDQVEEDRASEELKEDSEKDTQTTSKAGETLIEEIKALDVDDMDRLGFVLLNKSTNELIEVNADATFTSASLYKLYVAYAVLTEVDKGNVALDTVMDQSTNETVDDYLTDAITWSGNDTAIALADKLGWDTIENFIQENGFTGTTFNTAEENGNLVRGDLQTTPENVLDLLNRLMEGTLVSETSTDYFMSLLGDQQLDYALDTGLSDTVDFAHKTGVLDDVSHDAGIITDTNGQEYIVVVMSDGWEHAYEEADPVFAETGHSIMDYLSAQ